MVIIRRPKEQTIERYLYTQVKKRGGLCIKLTGYNGIPDRLVLLPGGRIEFIEVKREGEKPREDQLMFHDALRKRGFRVWAPDSKDVIDIILEDEQ